MQKITIWYGSSGNLRRRFILHCFTNYPIGDYRIFRDSDLYGSS